MYRQFEIWWVNLDPTQGVETQKKRPCLIIQSDLANKFSKSLIIAPFLPEHKPEYFQYVVNIMPSRHNGLDAERHMNLKQLRVVDISRIDNKKGRQGILEENYFPDIKKVLRIVFDL